MNILTFLLNIIQYTGYAADKSDIGLGLITIVI